MGLSIFPSSECRELLRYNHISGFADGTFTVKFTEQNPVSLVLNYGNSGDKNIMDFTCERHD